MNVLHFYINVMYKLIKEYNVLTTYSVTRTSLQIAEVLITESGISKI
jgi:hypothetical protein